MIHGQDPETNNQNQFPGNFTIYPYLNAGGEESSSRLRGAILEVRKFAAAFINPTLYRKLAGAGLVTDKEKIIRTFLD